MTAPPQQQLTPGDHQYFEWSTSKQQTNLIHPLMTQTHRKHYYQQLEDNQLKQNKTTTITSPLTLSPTSHIKKKQKINSIGSSSTFDTNDEQNQSQTCYPFQAELTQKIDIECGSGGGVGINGGNNNCNNINGVNQTTHTPTHHFTLSTVINVSVNSQTQKSLDIVPSSSSSQSQYPLKSHDQTNFHIHSSSSLIPSTELNLSLYLKDIDLTTFDSFILPSCPNPQDYLTVDGLLTFLMSDKNVSKQHPPIQQIYNHPQTQYNRYPYQQHQMSQYYNYPQQNLTGPCVPSTAMETGNSLYYRQSSLPQQMTKSYSTTGTTSTPSFR